VVGPLSSDRISAQALAERAGAQSQRGTEMHASDPMSTAVLGDQEQFPQQGGGDGEDGGGGGDDSGSGANGGGDSGGGDGGADINGGWGAGLLAITVTAVAALVHAPAARADGESTERVSRQAPPPSPVPPSVTITHPRAH